jgi:hypothetical protein
VRITVPVLALRGGHVGYTAQVPFALFGVGWLITLAAVVTGRLWLLAAAAPFFLLCGTLTLASQAAWDRLASAALASGIYNSNYRERVRSSDALRRFMSGGLVLLGVAWLAMGLLV